MLSNRGQHSRPHRSEPEADPGSSSSYLRPKDNRILALLDEEAPRLPQIPIAPKPPPRAIVDADGRIQYDDEGNVITVRTKAPPKAILDATKGFNQVPPGPVTTKARVPPPPLNIAPDLAAREAADGPQFEDIFRRLAPSIFAGGTLKALLGGKDCHLVSYALLQAVTRLTRKVDFTAFTFNEDEKENLLIEALCAAAQIVAVRVWIDARQSLRGRTRRQAQNLQRLVNAGAQVKIVEKGNGDQHSKTLLVGRMLVVGSTNWTNRSRSNFEMSALIELNPEGEQRHQTMIRDIDRQSRPFSPADLQLAVQHQRTSASSSVLPGQQLFPELVCLPAARSQI